MVKKFVCFYASQCTFYLISTESCVRLICVRHSYKGVKEYRQFL